MAAITEAQREERIAAVVARADPRESTGEVPLDTFSREYYRQVDLEDLDERTPEDLLGALLSHWQFASQRAKEDWATEFGDGSIAPPLSASAGPKPPRRVETDPEPLSAVPATLPEARVENITGVRTFEHALKRSPAVWLWLAVGMAAVGFSVLLASLLIKIG